MINEIFTSEERKLLEAYLTSAKLEQAALDNLLDLIKKKKSLYEDVFLYLQIRKNISC